MNQQTTSDSHVHRFYFCISINFSFIFYTSSDQIPNQLLIYGYCWYIIFLRLYYFSNTDVYIFSDVMPLDSFIIFILAERKSYIYFFIFIYNWNFLCACICDYRWMRMTEKRICIIIRIELLYIYFKVLVLWLSMRNKYTSNIHISIWYNMFFPFLCVLCPINILFLLNSQ